MAKVYRVTDKLPVKIGDIIFQISPLTFAQRAEIQADLTKAAKGDLSKATDASYKAIKYAVKSVENLTNIDGTPYQVTLENKILTDECVNDLLNLEEYMKLSAVTTNLINGVPEKICDAEGKVIEGIELLYKTLPNL